MNFSKANQHFTFAGESHDFWEIVYVMSGAVECTEDERIYRLTEDNMVLHAPMEFHKIRSADGTSPHVLVLSFESTGELPAGLKDGVFLLSGQEREEYEAIFYRVLALRSGKEKGKFAAQECSDSMAAFLVRLSEAHSARAQLSHSRDAQMYQRLVTVMKERMNFSSPSYFTVFFKKMTGMPPLEYIRQERK